MDECMGDYTDEFMAVHAEVFDEDNEIMQDVRKRRAEVAEMARANPNFWEEVRAEMIAEGFKFVNLQPKNPPPVPKWKD